MTTEHKPHSELADTVRKGIGSTWTSDEATNKRGYREAMTALDSLEEQLEACEADRNSLSKSADHLQEQFGVLQEKARRFLVATGGPPEKIEDVGKARRELVDALHASYPASRYYGHDWPASNQESEPS